MKPPGSLTAERKVGRTAHTANEPVAEAPGALAETEPAASAATLAVVTGNPALSAPGATATAEGTDTAGCPLCKVTSVPPAGAGCASVTVPRAVVPPITPGGSKLTIRPGTAGVGPVGAAIGSIAALRLLQLRQAVSKAINMRRPEDATVISDSAGAPRASRDPRRS